MRIALLTDGISPYVTGGMQRHSFNVCKYLASQGVHVDLYHCDPFGRIKGELSVFTEEERKFISPILIKFPDLGKMPGHYIKESFEYSKIIARELQKRPEVDFIYAKGFTAWYLLHLRSTGKIKLPDIGVNFHGYEMFQFQSGWLERLKAKFLLRSPVLYNVKHADYVFSYGGKITEVISSLGINKSKIVEIPGGVDESWVTDRAGECGKPFHFLFVGRSEPRKGLSELIQAYKMEFGNVAGKPKLTIVGAHNNKDKVDGIEYIQELSDQTELMKLYRSADILVVPSYAEGFPNVILEAMASGLAVLATDTGAVRLLVDDENGWLIDSPQISILRSSLRKAAETSEDLLLKKKQSSILKVKSEFTWQIVGATLLDFLNRNSNNNKVS